MQYSRVKWLISAMAVMTMTAPSLASNFPHWYVGLHGQLAYVPDADVSTVGLTNPEAEFNMGYAAGVAIGYRPYANQGILHNLRFEFEYSFREQDFNTLNTSGGSTSLDGDLQGNALMGNLYYDFHNNSQWTPYVGGGFGMMTWDFGSNTLGVEADDQTFAYQGMFGLYYEPELLPDTEWGFGYRYFATSDPDFRTNAGNSLSHDYDSHNIEFNARFRF